MMYTLRASALLGALMIINAPAPALAQDDGEEAVAAELMKQGFEAYAREQWADAILHWKQALVLKPEWSSLRYNIAQAYFRKKDYRSARAMALEAREATPPLKAELGKKNDELLAEIDRIEAEEAARKQAELDALRAQKAMADAVRPRVSNWIWVGTGALALGGISLGGAVWQSNKLVDVREQMKVPQTRPEYDALREIADGHQTLGQVFFLSSAALAATSVGIIVWDLMTPEEDAQEEAAPTQTSFGVTPTGAFVRMSW
jgi:tetratricopeptide (TPR) repeat protein